VICTEYDDCMCSDCVARDPQKSYAAGYARGCAQGKIEGRKEAFEEILRVAKKNRTAERIRSLAAGEASK